MKKKLKIIWFNAILCLNIVFISSTLQNSKKHVHDKTSMRSCGTDQCECNFDAGFSEVESQFRCPYNLSNISFETQPDDDDYVGDSWAKVERLKISCCRLPLGQSITTYLKKDRLKNISRLYINSNGANRNLTIETEHFQGLKNIRKFELKGLKDEFRSLPVNVFDAMKQIKLIAINVPNIHLPVGLFDKLGYLTDLDLSGCNLKRLEPGLLNLRKLRYLYLGENALQILNKESFRGLISLEYLDLKSNSLESLDSDVFLHLKNLVKIDLSANRFTALPEGLFANNKELNDFKMVDNSVNLTTLPNDLFANLTRLETVEIECGLRKISESIFMGSSRLENILLQNNAIEKLPNNLLRDQSKLEKLDLSKNVLKNIADLIFCQFAGFKLFLGGNQISNLKRETLDHLFLITELDLSRNQLDSLETDVLYNLTDLTDINLGGNNLSVLPDGLFSNNKNLQTINLENNELESLPEKLLANNSKLHVLILSGNKITQVESLFLVGSRFLRKLHLSRNRLKNLPDKLFESVSYLEALHLDHNQITSDIWKKFPDSLKILNLSHNNITDFSTEFLNISRNSNHLTIDLTHNLINKIDYLTNKLNISVDLGNNPILCDCNIYNFVGFLEKTYKQLKANVINLTCAGPKNLEGKNLSDLKSSNLTCQLDREETSSICPEGCECVVQLEIRTLKVICGAKANYDNLLYEPANLKWIELTIENTNLSKIPEIPRSWFNVVTNLKAGGNKIREITATDIPPYLRTLELNNNKLSTFDQSVINFLSGIYYLREVKLAGNPWNCSCENSKFISSILFSGISISDFDEMKCSDGSSFEDLNIDDICFNPLTIIISCTVGIAFVLSALAAFFYKFEKRIKIWLYAHNLCLWFVTEEELDKDKVYDAFISYSQNDSEFVSEKLIPKLEFMDYKLCLHERDWVPGVEISTQISKSVNDAKRTIIVMSPNFLQSSWATWEFRVAQSHAATEKRSRIIVILFGDIGDVEKLEPDLRDYLKLNTYVKWGDQLFWEKLKYALPHKRSTERQKVVDF